MSPAASLHAQLASIMEVLANTAVAEICELVDSGLAVLQLEVSRSRKENEALRRKLRLVEIRAVRVTASGRTTASGTALRTTAAGRTTAGGTALRTTAGGRTTACGTALSLSNGRAAAQLAAHHQPGNGRRTGKTGGVTDTQRRKPPPLRPNRNSNTPRSLPTILWGRIPAARTPATAFPRRQIRDSFHIVTDEGNGQQGKQFFCTFCGKTLACLKNLRTHLRVHTGEKPFVCSLCGTRFSDSSNLKRHQSVHTGEKRYGCAHCGKRFAQSGSLKVHMSVHTDCKQFRCSFCGKTFISGSHLRRHVTEHVNEKRFEETLP
ncbi:hypothetical protein JOQ06_022976 [Pogonophryne albipinna]|uniref:C2H2-type domain-containing protein n=1 Tax=Pogonophryne albipinna TaxID=1090488 RepID=A0AAD6A814_9TELE|nr:hypothetical protein JOQ06_022976 [Pogonophryne albipinna]